MANFIAFNEGRQTVEDTGWPATVYFLLSTKQVGTQLAGEHIATNTLATAGHAGEITGTGYSRASQAEPAASGLGRKLFTQMSWATGAATDWPASVRSIVAVTTTDNTGRMICAWNLQSGGAARDMSQANTTLNVTPDYAPTNPA